MRLPEVRFVACHRIPERSFFFHGRQLPVCARCTGMLLGYLTYPLFLFGMVSVGFWWSVALNIPAYIDGTTQAVGWRESNNALRLSTGILSGIGQIGIISIVGRILAQLILHLASGGV